jgi:hypothetical protein
MFLSIFYIFCYIYYNLDQFYYGSKKTKKNMRYSLIYLIVQRFSHTNSSKYFHAGLGACSHRFDAARPFSPPNKVLFEIAIF